MQIVIDIPKALYNRILDKCYTDADLNHICGAVTYGTPLSKGHGRLIDADDCKKNKRDFCEESTRTNWYDTIDDLLDDAPTIIEADEGDKE